MILGLTRRVKRTRLVFGTLILTIGLAAYTLGRYTYSPKIIADEIVSTSAFS